MGDSERFKEYLQRVDVPLFLKMSELAKRGPTGDFLDNWKIIRSFISRELCSRKLNGNGLTEQEKEKWNKLRRMARYKRSQSR